MTKSKVVLVEDDDMLRPLLAGNLEQAGYDVVEFADGKTALGMLGRQDRGADLLILDWELPGMTGLDLLRQLRCQGIVTPALFFTSHNDTLYEEAALGCGAVDFVDKTRSFAILLKRIELILSRRTGANDDGPSPKHHQVGHLTLDAPNHTVQWQGTKVELTFGEFRVVEHLVQAQRDVTYREIYDVLRGESFMAGEGPEGHRANVRALIKRIREKFCAVDPDFTEIANFPGFGYRWGKDV